MAGVDILCSDKTGTLTKNQLTLADPILLEGKEYQVEGAAGEPFTAGQGKSRREAPRVFGLSRDTIAKMCRYSAPPGYVRSKAPERPKLGPLVPVIDAILEADKTAPPKQRHTAKRIFERLRIEHGFAGGYTVVKDYVRLARTGSREVFVPLAHPPGHAQVDFGECIGVIGGVRMKLHVFCFDLRRARELSAPSCMRSSCASKMA
jgi:transposase